MCKNIISIFTSWYTYNVWLKIFRMNSSEQQYYFQLVRECSKHYIVEILINAFNKNLLPHSRDNI